MCWKLLFLPSLVVYLCSTLLLISNAQLVGELCLYDTGLHNFRAAGPRTLTHLQLLLTHLRSPAGFEFSSSHPSASSLFLLKLSVHIPVIRCTSFGTTQASLRPSLTTISVPAQGLTQHAQHLSTSKQHIDPILAVHSDPFFADLQTPDAPRRTHSFDLDLLVTALNALTSSTCLTSTQPTPRRIQASPSRSLAACSS
ncbi:hypothetical protein M758_5G196800 [Ceratodon purpureus]|nr:hypothetical protein M758_5G196800 [Ceratodon purpureus]